MRVLAIASAGGHWVQLLRLLPAFEENEIVFVSTHKSFSQTVKNCPFYVIPDANRWNKLKLLKVCFCVLGLLYIIKPDVIITTGAAPGLMAVIAGRLLGAKTIWIDSIANVEKLSLSGRIALLFANRTYTQWPDLATSKIKYKGSVIG
ncbi:glycosyltransferase family protein [Pontibacter burrus]|uniref:Oligosaccharide biosynthesis protein Alg14 n=1 Tax=Pontibacter burrus TaxID=2704466 RepID=A0A6B3LWC9_9BACT|nr:oligosaccharide biosynthesis protein Alg14 [Pontibacter burrus]NEM97751.1 oligosaccharide biosynthesis protein Alg14 [Pontibacter burrus]